MKFDSIKKAPTGGTVKGETLNTNLSYQDEDGLSTAAQILLSICQTPEYANSLNNAQWKRIEQILREHYKDKLFKVSGEVSQSEVQSDV